MSGSKKRIKPSKRRRFQDRLAKRMNEEASIAPALPNPSPTPSPSPLHQYGTPIQPVFPPGTHVQGPYPVGTGFPPGYILPGTAPFYGYPQCTPPFGFYVPGGSPYGYPQYPVYPPGSQQLPSNMLGPHGSHYNRPPF